MYCIVYKMVFTKSGLLEMEKVAFGSKTCSFFFFLAKTEKCFFKSILIKHFDVKNMSTTIFSLSAISDDAWLGISKLPMRYWYTQKTVGSATEFSLVRVIKEFVKPFLKNAFFKCI